MQTPTVIKERSFVKVIFRPLMDLNENLIYCKTISLLFKISYDKPVALFPVTRHFKFTSDNIPVLLQRTLYKNENVYK